MARLDGGSHELRRDEGGADPATRCSRRALDRARSVGRTPPFQALWLARTFPEEVLGPVDRDHGCHRRIASACLARRSADHPLTIALPQ